MSQAGLTLLPGTIEPVSTADEAQKVADDIGYPVIIKAAAGGGGRGMTVVRAERTCELPTKATRAAAQTIFRDSAVYIERYLEIATAHRDPDRLRLLRQWHPPRRT